MRDEDRRTFRPDKYRLDEEWEAQPDLFHDEAEKLAKAKSAFKEAEAEAERIKAEVSLKIRKDPKAYGFDKVTEEMIKSLALVQPEYQRAKKDEIRKQFLMDDLVGKVRTMEHRKTALEELRALFLADYFARPRGRETPELAERRSERTLERLKTKKRAEDD